MKLENRAEEVLVEMQSGKSISEVAQVFGVTKEACLYFRQKRGMPPLGIYPRHSPEERAAKSIRMKGHGVSQETKDKISAIHTGKKLSPERIAKWRASMSWKPHTIETRMKMSQAHRKLGRMKGDKNISWKGGVSNENFAIRNGIETRLWREAVFARDNFTCQDCFIRGGELHAHHIKSFADFPELRFAIDNGKTMCVSCHGVFHKRNLKGLNK